jgi:hypothetical protein
MVKTPTTAKKKHPGRPAADPADLRTARVAIRFHPDLVFELDGAAREAGLNRSIYVERILVNYLNAHAERRERPPLDVIGRYLTEEAIERLRRTSAAPSGYDRLRQSISSDGDYITPTAPIPRSHHVSAFGKPRRDPTGPRAPKPKPGKEK